MSSCSPAEAPFLLPFSLPDGDGLEAEKAGRIASLLGEPGGSRRSQGKSKCCSSEATVRSQKEAVARWAGLGREGEAAGWDEPPPFSLGPTIVKTPTHCIQTTATSSRTAGGRMVEKRTTATKDGILGGQVPSARWPAMARVTAARCPDHAPSYKPVSCWQAHAFPGLKLGF